MQTIKVNLATLTYAAAGAFQILLNALPTRLMGRFTHLEAITFEADLDPTFTTAPTEIGVRNIIKRLRINDGRNDRFVGAGLAALRMREILENGGLVHPDPDTNSGTTNNFYARHTWTPGPKRFANPSDFSIPCAALQNGIIEGNFGALADISADATAATTGVVKVIAHLSLKDEITLPPVYEWREYPAAGSELRVAGRALVPFAAAFDDANYAAISAGDFGAFTVETGLGPVISAVDAELLTAAFHAEMLSGHFTPAYGEPRSTTDDNPKVVNGGTPTALVAPAARVQPVLFAPPGTKISKVVAYADGLLTIGWNGAQSTGVFAVGRILEQPMTAIATVGDEAARQLKIATAAGAAAKTLSKRPYQGPRSAFMPYKMAV